ncbi:MAG: hypothetical protein ACRCVX_12500 [Shewanella sp.]
MPAYVPLVAFKRVPFVDDDGCTLAFVGLDWSSAAFLMHIRNLQGDTGAPLVALTNAGVGTQGISALYAPVFPYPNDSNAIVTGAATKILVQIDEATLENLALGTPYKDAVTLHYDIHCTPPGLAKRIIAYGEFVIKPGVTI